ncbi:TPA_asm: hypothetical protein GahPV1_gp25 [Geoglobus ahangari pleomorphic virus 1]|uniref:Uncharacterized protein n=2 Tax=root TaxID=1 RepID=A0A0F7II16_9EURY|nr:hypothetical protein [Geoglobus ahangari]AKG92399.1 hypothetical protein GAH_00245 [Geoglobus ahangari]
MNKLMNAINSAIENDGFLFIGILGDKGLGKTVLGMNITYDILRDWRAVLRHMVFTITDFSNLSGRSDLIRHTDGRIKAVLWDDFALHTSSYGFTKKGEREQLIDFIEDFEVVREEVAVLIVTAATWEMIPPKLRDAAHIFIQMTKRGKGEVWAKQRGWLFLRKDYKKIGEIESQKIPDEIYNEYREMKRKAKRVKEKMTVIKQKERAKNLANELSPEEWEDVDLLTAYGILDMHGNLTEFGKLVKKYAEEAGVDHGGAHITYNRWYVRGMGKSHFQQVSKDSSKVDGKGRVSIPHSLRRKYGIEQRDIFLWLDFDGFVIGVPDQHFENFMDYFFKREEEAEA